MEIRLLAFGQIGDIVGQPEIIFSGINNTDELQIKLAEIYHGIAAIDYSMAVNKTLVQKNTLLNNGDTVALLPPFSGG